MLVICPSVRVRASSLRMGADPVKVDVPLVPLYGAYEVVYWFPPEVFSACAVHEACHPFAVSVHGHDCGVGGESPSDVLSDVASHNKGKSLHDKCVDMGD